MIKILVRIKGIILRPVPTLREVKERKPSLLEPFLIILSQGLLTGIAALISVLKILNVLQIDPNEVGLKGISGVRMIYGTLIFSFATWLMVSGVFHLTAKIFKGSGKFEKLLELIGWCRIPQIFSSGSNLLTAALYSPKIDVPLQGMSSTEKAEFIRNYLMTRMDEVSFVANRIFGYVMLIWFLYLSIFAVKEEHNISFQKAALSVAIPSIIYLIGSLFLLSPVR